MFPATLTSVVEDCYVVCTFTELYLLGFILKTYKSKSDHMKRMLIGSDGTSWLLLLCQCQNSPIINLGLKLSTSSKISIFFFTLGSDLEYLGHVGSIIKGLELQTS